MRRTALLALVSLLLLLPVPAGAGDPKLTIEDLVARHLESVAPAATRALLKSRGAEGTAHYEIILGGRGQADGNFMLLCDGPKYGIALRFGSADYPGEQFLFNGDKSQVATTRAAMRSNLGTFLYRQDRILREGLLGGVLSSSWPLLDLKARQPRLKYDGLKKVDGVPLHQVTYAPNGGPTDLQIKLYFEPDTFRHVKTVYRVTAPPGMVSSQTQSPSQQDTYYILQETFSEFRGFDGFSLPTRWRVQFSVEGSQTVQARWEVTLGRVVNNAAIDAKDFDIP